jgi:hypothetical protein
MCRLAHADVEKHMLGTRCTVPSRSPSAVVREQRQRTMAQLELACRWSVDFVELLVNVNLCPAFVEQRVSA